MANLLHSDLPSFDDEEGRTVPAGLPGVIDAHVHTFPDHVFRAIRRWFDENAWHIRYPLSTSEVFDFLLSHGVGHVIALQYAHAPGIARDLNRYLAEQCRHYPGQATGMATVLPGEPEAEAILQEAFDSGLGGLKLHAHVQCFDLDADDSRRVLDVCRSHGKPAVIHIGKEPKSSAYRCDPYEICSADKLERVLAAFPDLRICVPHLGFSEIREYKELIEKHDNLWLDTTMALTDYFPIEDRIELGEYRIDRIMYGSDFPNIPYAWDRELKCIGSSGLPASDLERVLYRNAVEFFDLAVRLRKDSQKTTSSPSGAPRLLPRSDGGEVRN
ncbi:MAG: amidohydrolase family protein [Desulfobacterales bacterium]